MRKTGESIFVYDSVVDPLFQRGVDRCFTNYTSALSNAFPGRVSIYSKRDSLPFAEKIIVPPSKNLKISTPKKIRSLLDISYGQFVANRDADIFYSPFYGWIDPRIPQVYTAHDMIFEKFPQYFSGKDHKRVIFQKKRCFERAELILCVSRNTANDIQQFYPDICGEKIRVIPNGIDDVFFSDSSSNYSGRPYFLYVGNRSYYKNFLRLLAAFGRSGLAKEFDLRIISPIDNFPNEQEEKIIQDHHLEGRIISEISVSDETLVRRYREAFAFVFPSEYEGFGLPLLEAMASGTMVIASNTSSLPEIGGDVPIYFDPYSIDSIIDSLKFASSISESDRDQRIEQGRSRAQVFRWSRSQAMFIENIKLIL